VYSSKYVGGDLVRVVLVSAHGFWAIQAILAAVLVALGRAWIVAIVTAVSVLASVPLLVGLIRVAGATGAAIGSGLIALGIIVVFAALLSQQLGTIVRRQNMTGIASVTAAMALVSLLGFAVGGGSFVATAAGLLAYGGTLIALGEVKADDA
jgi:O-antigen/teichoic acid export membrane protein